MLEFRQIGFLEDPIDVCAEIAAAEHAWPTLFVGTSDDEVRAFVTAAAGLKFTQPAEGEVYNGMKCISKRAHLANLLADGVNIAVANSLFKYCDDAILRMIRCNGYRLLSPGDAIMWADKINACNGDNVTEAINRKQLAAVAQETFLLSPAHRADYVLDMMGIKKFTYTGRLLIRLMSKGRTEMYWGLHPLLFESFPEACIVHQAPGASPLIPYLDMLSVLYVVRADGPDLRVPDPRLLHIVQDERYNQKGEDAVAYSSHWYSGDKNALEGVFKDMLNVLVHSGAGGERRELVTYAMPNDVLKRVDEAGVRSVFRGRGFQATQQYSAVDCTSARVLCYCANPYFPSASVNYLRKNEVDLDQDAYATYHLLRWISRSAVLGGEPVTVYVPSKRMRGLLESWIQAQGE